MDCSRERSLQHCSNVHRHEEPGPDLSPKVLEALVEHCEELGLLEEGEEILGVVEARECGDVEAGQTGEVVCG